MGNGRERLRQVRADTLRGGLSNDQLRVSGLELTERVRTLMARYDASDWVGLYAAQSFELQKAQPLGKLRTEMTRLRAVTGPVKALRLANSETGPQKTTPQKANPPKNSVTQTFEVDFEKTQGRVMVSQLFEDGRWHITGFALEPVR